MTQSHFKLPVTLTIKGPVLTAGFTMASWGTDKTFYRNWRGKLALPDSLVRGKLKEAMKAIQEFCEPASGLTVEDWFGRESGDKKDDRGSYLPVRGKIKVDDFILKESCQRKNKSQTRIRIDPHTCTADRGALYIKEVPFSPGENTLWGGGVEFFCSDAELQKYIKPLKEAFSFITSMGAEKTIGFGRLVKVEFGEPEEFGKTVKTSQVAVNHQTKSQIGLKLAIKPLEPILVGGVRKTENIFAGEEIISGAVLKGSFATGLNCIAGHSDLNKVIDENNEEVESLYSSIAKHFSGLRFLHAKPCSCLYNRFKTIPLSGVCYGKKYKDVAFLPEEEIYASGTSPATFQVDWKPADYKWLPGEYESPSLEYHPVTRTAIEPDMRVADEGNLYSHHMIKPESGGKQLYWNSEIIFPASLTDAQKNDLSSELEQALQKAFHHLGKRRSGVAVEVKPLEKKNLDWRSGCKKFSITFETPAVTINPSDLADFSDKRDRDAFDEREKLKELYADYWNRLFGDSVCFETFFASQELRGGYLGMRFMEKEYRPFYLTSEGSVFVFSVLEEEKVEKVLARLITGGLDLPEWARGTQGEDAWKTCPFVPENGFGEISVSQE